MIHFWGQLKCQQSLNLTMQKIRIDALSVTALMTYLTNCLEKQNNGTLVVIVSVAGDGDRVSNYVYGSAKVMVSSFAFSLRQRLKGSKLKVVKIKPGFIDTPMTAEFKRRLPWASPSSVLHLIVHACVKKIASFTYLDFSGSLCLRSKKIPECVFKRLSL